MPEYLRSSAPGEIKEEIHELKSPEQQDIKERNEKVETFGNLVDKVKSLSEHGYEKGNKSVYYRATDYQISLYERGQTQNGLKIQYNPDLKTMTASTIVNGKTIHIGADEAFTKIREFTDSDKATAFLKQFPEEKKNGIETADKLAFTTLLSQAQALQKYGYNKDQKIGVFQLSNNSIMFHKRNENKGFDRPIQLRYISTENKLLAEKVDPETKQWVPLDLKQTLQTMNDLLINDTTEKYLVDKKAEISQQKAANEKLEMGWRRKFMEVSSKAQEAGIKKIKTEDGSVIKFARNGSNEIQVFPSKEDKQEYKKENGDNLFYIRILADKMIFVDKNENQSKQPMKDYGRQVASIEETLNKHIEDEKLEKDLKSLN